MGKLSTICACESSMITLMSLEQIRNGISLSQILCYNKFNEFQGKEFYLGEIKTYLLDGKGKYVWAYGDYYESEYKNNNGEGKGKYVWGPGHNKGDYYDGEFKNDKKEGKGKYVWADGHYYEGEFKNNNMEGKGKFYFSDKNRQIEEIQEGNCVNDLKEGFFKITLPNQAPFYREFSKSKPITK